MDLTNLIKIANNNSYELSVNEQKNYILLSFIGVWDKEAQLDYYIADIKKGLDKIKTRFNLIIDLGLYRGTASEHIHLHIEAQNLALKAGLNRVVVVLKNNDMLKTAVDCILKATGLSATYFDNLSIAEQWLLVDLKE